MRMEHVHTPTHMNTHAHTKGYCLTCRLVVEILTSKDKKKRMAKIEKECAMLDKAMSTFVDVHFEGFIQSINSYTHILQAVSMNKREVSNLKQVVRKCRDMLVQRSASHLPALWNVRSQCTEMIALLDCIAWLKNVPYLLESYLRGEGIESYASSQRERKAEQLLPQTTDSRFSVGETSDAMSVGCGPHPLHASLLLLSAATLLTAQSPRLNEGSSETKGVFVVPVHHRCLDPESVHPNALESPLARIPALRHLREALISRYLVRMSRLATGVPR